MLKLTVVILIIIAIVLAWTLLRQRLRRSVRFGLVLYALVMVARLSQAQTDQETLISLGVILGVFGFVWLGVWGVTNWMLSRSSPR